jgi:hypothetical protein
MEHFIWNPNKTFPESFRMFRCTAVFLLLVLNADAALAFPVNWGKRVGRFTAYVERNIAAQSGRVRVLERLSDDFQRRSQGYTRALERRARPFQTGSGAPGE